MDRRIGTRVLASFTWLAVAAAAACSASSSSASRPSSPYVLVHGAWMGAWAWDDVATRLRATGAKVTVVELPAHGADTAAASEGTLEHYAAKVGAAVDAEGAPVVLVAHSMGGVVATRVAEERPQKIAKLVYLAAYVPKDGETLQALAGRDQDSHVGPALAIDTTKGTAGIPSDKLKDIFCADCDDVRVDLIRRKYKDEPLAAFGAPVHTTAANWGRVPKYYVFTKNDHAVSYALQQSMTGGVELVSTTTLESSHSPFLSEPDKTVAALTGF